LLDVVGDGAPRDDEAVRDLGIAAATGDQRRDLALAGRQHSNQLLGGRPIAFRAAQRQLDGDAAQVPILVSSGAREVRARATELGAVEALSKPFDLNQVVAAVGRWIRVGPPSTE